MEQTCCDKTNNRSFQYSIQHYSSTIEIQNKVNSFLTPPQKSRLGSFSFYNWHDINSVWAGKYLCLSYKFPIWNQISEKIIFDFKFKKFDLFIKCLLIKKHIILTLILQLSQPIGLLLTFSHSHRFYFITFRLFYSVGWCCLSKSNFIVYSGSEKSKLRIPFIGYKLILHKIKA